MLVKFGAENFVWNKPPRPGTKQNWEDVRYEFEQLLSNALVSEAEEFVREATPGQIRELQASIKNNATTEAARIFTTMSRIIDSRNSKLSPAGGELFTITGLRTSDLEASYGRTSFEDRRRLGDPLAEAGYQGSVPWRRLSLSWTKQKSQRWPENTNKFFKATGRLQGLLDKGGRGYVESWFGGIQVEAPSVEAPRKGRKAELKGRTVLGKLEVYIFPRISPLLLPGLASRNWTNVDKTAALEKRVITTVSTKQKLAGQPAYHRPFLQPILQFWVLYRIPRAISMTVNKWFSDDHLAYKGGDL